MTDYRNRCFGMCRKQQFLSLSFLLCTTWSIVAYTDAVKSSRCPTELRVLWSRAVGSAPFASVPLVSYVDGDAKLDIVAALSTGDVYVLQGENGQNPPSGRWPYTAQQTSVHASPIQYDLDGDGVLDLLILTTAGELVGLKPNGDPIPPKHGQLPPVYVARDWNKNVTRADGADINKYIMELPPEAADEASYVAIGPRVLASAVLTDIGGNGVPDHLIIPVSYYVDPMQYMRLPDTGQLPDMYNYLASAVVIFNLTSMRPTRTILMELTTVTSDHPGYILFSPAVAELDKNGSDLEIIVTTQAGYLHVVNSDGQVRPGFPIYTGIPCGQVAVEDINHDGQLELVVADVSGDVTCYAADGRELWKTHISASCTGGPLVADLRLLGTMDIAVATNDGRLWVLDGVTGRVVTGWPVKVATSLSAPVLVTRLSHTAVPSLAILADDHHIHIVSGDGKCRQTLNIGQLSFVSMSAHDLVPDSPGLELLVASRDGTILCVGQAPHHQVEPLSSLYSSPADHVRSGAAYYNGKRGIIIVSRGDTEAEFSGSIYTLTVEILDSDATPDPANKYRIHVLLGNQLLATTVYNSTGQYNIVVAVPPHPLTAQMQVRMTTRHGQVFSDHLPVRFHTAFIGDLQWLLVVPTLLVATLLLFTHGFPAVDLLPRSLASKGS